MSTLKEALGSGDKRQALIDDACQVLDQEVADKSGISGMAVKAAFKVIKGIKPGFIREVVDALLDDFLEALQPLHAESRERGEEPGAFLTDNPGQAAEALLAITDERAKQAQRAVVKKTYDKLRPTARKHVEASMPRLKEMMRRHID